MDASLIYYRKQKFKNTERGGYEKIYYFRNAFIVFAGIGIGGRSHRPRGGGNRWGNVRWILGMTTTRSMWAEARPV
jgi:hypothetical protein